MPTPTITASAWTSGPSPSRTPLALPSLTMISATEAPEISSVPLAAVQVGEDLGDLPAEHPQQRQLGHLDQVDLDAGGAGGGSGLQADPAAPRSPRSAMRRRTPP